MKKANKWKIDSSGEEGGATKRSWLPEQDPSDGPDFAAANNHVQKPLSEQGLDQLTGTSFICLWGYNAKILHRLAISNDMDFWDFMG